MKKEIKKIKQNKGITLVTLVITIIVLAILTGVSINALVGENGLITAAKNTADKANQVLGYHQDEINMMIGEMANWATGDWTTEGGSGGDGGSQLPSTELQAYYQISNNKATITVQLLSDGTINSVQVLKSGELIGTGTVNGSVATLANINKNGTYTIKVSLTVDGTSATKTASLTISGIKEPDVEEGEEATSNTTINGMEPSYSNPIIPAGYTPVNTDGAKWDAESGPEYNNGLVIKDDSGNEWVWVPVPDVSTMFEGTSRKLRAGVEYIQGEYGSIAHDIYRNTPYISKIRYKSGDKHGVEPYFDYKDFSSYWKGAWINANTSIEAAEDYISKYTLIVESVGKFQGFYIARYELTGTMISPKSAPGKVLSADYVGTWFHYYGTCERLKGDNDNVYTSMILGCMWDEATIWITSTKYNGDTSVVDTDSASIGNYINSEVRSSDGSTVLKSSTETKKLETGITTQTMLNNIYDLAGNCAEWTQELEDGGSPVYFMTRGGGFSDKSTVQTLSDRDNWECVVKDDYITTRATLVVVP